MAKADPEPNTIGQKQIMSTLSQTTILAVEDNLSDILLLSHTLKQNGFRGEFLTADSADAGYRLMVERLDSSLPLPNLVLLDLGLPDESGLEMLEKLKSAPILSAMKVVVFSGSKSTKDMSKARELGAEWYFIKPSNPADLKFVVQELIGIAERK